MSGVETCRLSAAAQQTGQSASTTLHSWPDTEVLHAQKQKSAPAGPWTEGRWPSGAAAGELPAPASPAARCIGNGRRAGEHCMEKAQHRARQRSSRQSWQARAQRVGRRICCCELQQQRSCCACASCVQQAGGAVREAHLLLVRYGLFSAYAMSLRLPPPTCRAVAEAEGRAVGQAVGSAVGPATQRQRQRQKRTEAGGSCKASHTVR